MGLADITTSLHITGLGAFSTGNLSFSEKMPQGWSLVQAILPTTTTRVPFTSEALKEVIPILLILYSLAVLVQLPNTKTARLSLLPIIVSLSYRVITKYDTAAPFDDPGYTYHNLAFGCFTIFLCLRAIDFGTADKPWQRTIWSWRPKAAPDDFVTRLKYAMLDAFDLTMNNRGIGWSWGKGIYDPPQSAKHSAPRTALASFPFFISFVKAMVLFDFTLLAQQSWTLHPSAYPTHPIGGTIFDPTLPPHLRIGKVILMTFLCALGLCTSFQMSYYGLAFAMIALGGQQPEQWPPMFDEPWRATSLADFWGKRWHQMFKRAFVVAGGKPFGRYFGRPGGVIGSFLVSGLMHDFGVWGLGLGMDLSGVTLFFVMMGIGCVLEGIWEQKALKGKKVQGPLGWVWAMIWMFAWGSLIVDAWARRGLIESKMLPDGARPAVWWAQVTQKWLASHA
ncbi:hypothetical protein HETIRDRAFT_479381 [Heterobasidion irregulare TC 32-1]|uniref:Wax synthase domain-containing protein n=1 Tax=Heterobasidion irregulare (strain TC 32-1) TaxID=747525 RepID=W4JYI7_HETIT|nr:uncharacterized protein HETIRDRAFT_479381 [Heterobasidion irregulare TC 32-1]ETW78170.1 hypothetical protein HETIRDRAFT_479381 [Heterobasidion irregulare TC 32-1]